MYNVIISDQANEDIDCQLEYILRQFNNQQAIDAIIADIDETLGYIEDNPYVFSDYDNNGQKRAHLQRHRYKFIFSIFEENKEVHINRFIHDLQDR